MEYVVEKEPSQATIEQVIALAQAYVPGHFTENFPDDMRIDMRFQRAMYLQEGAEILSCIVFTCLDGSAHITLMVTQPSCKRNGYGRLLMQHFVDHVSSLGLHSVELYTFSPKTRPVYAATVAFYESVGFRREKEIRDLWEDGTITLKMRKSW